MRYYFIMVQIALMICFLGLHSMADGCPREDRAFERLYAEWKSHVEQCMVTRFSAQSTIRTDALYDNESFRQIVALGASAARDIIGRIPDDRLLIEALQRIAKWKYCVVRVGDAPRTFEWKVVEFPHIVTRGGPPDQVAVWQYWWREGRFQTATRFKALYAQWCKLNDEKKSGEADKVYRQIVNLGLPVMPCLVGVVGEHSEFVAAVSELSDGALPKNSKPEECKTWWAKNKDRFTLPPLTSSEDGASQSKSVEKTDAPPLPQSVNGMGARPTKEQAR